MHKCEERSEKGSCCEYICPDLYTANYTKCKFCIIGGIYLPIYKVFRPVFDVYFNPDNKEMHEVRKNSVHFLFIYEANAV